MPPSFLIAIVVLAVIVASVIVLVQRRRRATARSTGDATPPGATYSDSSSHDSRTDAFAWAGAGGASGGAGAVAMWESGISRDSAPDVCTFESAIAPGGADTGNVDAADSCSDSGDSGDAGGGGGGGD